MLKPAGTFSFAAGSLSAAVGSGGGATGASFCAASLSGRPISGEPGGSAGAAAGAAAGGLACWPVAPNVNTPRNAPASNRLRGDGIVVISLPPLKAAALILARARSKPAGQPDRTGSL